MTEEKRFKLLAVDGWKVTSDIDGTTIEGLLLGVALFVFLAYAYYLTH
jgi:hypothetical protein